MHAYVTVLSRVLCVSLVSRKLHLTSLNLRWLCTSVPGQVLAMSVATAVPAEILPRGMAMFLVHVYVCTRESNKPGKDTLQNL